MSVGKNPALEPSCSLFIVCLIKCFIYANLPYDVNIQQQIDVAIFKFYLVPREVMFFPDEVLTMRTATKGKTSPNFYLVLLCFSGMNGRFLLALL